MQSRRQTYSRLHHHSRSSTSLKDPYLDRLTRFWTMHDRTRMTQVRQRTRQINHASIWQTIQSSVAAIPA